MRKEFLLQVAEIFVNNYEDELEDINFIFPNRRSSVFFQRYLGQAASHPILSPKIYTINDLFTKISGLVQEDRLHLLYDLYLSYKKFVPDFHEEFDEFIFWGDTILSDFEDADKYLVDTQMLFTNINDLNEIDANYSYLTDNQKNAIKDFWGHLLPYREQDKEKDFLNIWGHLSEIYTDFNTVLDAKSMTYEGKAYRKVVNMCNENHLKDIFSDEEKVIFVGFNALNECELKFFDCFKKRGIADYYWDYYGKMITDKKNMSSFFMKDNVIRYPSKYELDGGTDGLGPKAGGVRMEDRNIELVGVPSANGQAKIVSEILEKIEGEKASLQINRLDTAVVLPDQKMLLPILSSIPECIEKVNVTMGYSLKNSNVAFYMSQIIELQRKVRIRDGKTYYYHSNIFQILKNPLTKKYAEKFASTKICKNIIASNSIYVSVEDLAKNDFFKLIFDEKAGSVDTNSHEMNLYLSDYFQRILMFLSDYLNKGDKEFVYYYYTAINNLKDLNLPLKRSTYFKLLEQTVALTSIPFRGEPLSGLQVMGNLEMRSLDFENLIICSVNEGTFPSKSVKNSFIPYNLRKGFGLPNYEYQDAVSAYHFYRSLYRVKNLYLIYDTRVGGMTTGEVSRYVKQLKYQHHHPIKEHNVIYSIPNIEEKELIIEKDEEYFDRLNKMKFSASALNNYLGCPMKFYFQKIKGIEEPDAVAEEIEPNIFGTLYHDTMHAIYKDYEHELITSSLLKKLSSDQNIENHVNKQFFKQNIYHVGGKNKIVEALLKRYVKQTLAYDNLICVKYGSFDYVEGEKKCFSSFPIFNGKNSVNLVGYIDRLDKVNGELRIIDYKTGGCNLNYKKSVENMFDRECKTRPYTAFQLFFYYLLCDLDMPNLKDMDVELNIYSLKDIFKNNILVCENNYDLLMEYKEKLKELLEEIFDKNQLIRCTDNTDICAYCPYKILCNR
ncbi:MAG: PD-(D/E)XK nuclease family protein [Bacteroidales bacterium]